MRLSLKPSDALFLALAAGLVSLYVLASGGGFPLDDSWIHQVFGRNLALTGRWEFVPGQASAASTSPLYTVLLAVGYRLGITYPLWTHGLGALALALTGMIGARLAARASGGERYVPLLTGVALIVTWHLIWAAAAGMETMLFGLFTLVLIALAWRELDSRSADVRPVALRGVVFGVFAGLTTLTRPEGVLLVGIIGLVMLVAQPQGNFTRVLVWGAAASVSFLAVLSPYLALNIQLTGGLLPDTAAAKQAENAPLLAKSYLTRVVSMVTPLSAGGQILLVPGMVYYAVSLGRRGLLYLLPILWGIGLILLYAAYLPAYYQHGRYVMPALPALIVTGVVGSAQLVRLARASLPLRVISRALVISAALVFVYFALVAGRAAYQTDVRIIEEEMVNSARWIAEHVPPDELLVIHDIGAVGYFAPRPILDIAGLVTPEIVPFILDAEKLWAYIEEQGGRYLMAFPDQIPGGDMNDPRLCRVYMSSGETARRADNPNRNMSVYALAWDGACLLNN